MVGQMRRVNRLCQELLIFCANQKAVAAVAALPCCALPAPAGSRSRNGVMPGEHWVRVPTFWSWE